MAIHQIQFQYDQHEDRLLLRVSTTEGDEFRFWLTRRFTGQLWGLLVNMLGWDDAVRQQFDDDARRNVLEIQHEGYGQQGDFSKKFEDVPRRLPLGDAPILLARAKGTKGKDGLQVVSLHPHQGQGIDLTLDTKLLHIIVRLLRQAVMKAEWSIDLRLYKGSEQPAPALEAAPRRLN
jgi:hypothetical protein